MSEKQSILFAAINNIVVRFGQQLISLSKHIIIAGFIGLSNQLDIFYMSLAIYGVLITSWAVVFDVLAIPKLVEYQVKKKTSIGGGRHSKNMMNKHSRRSYKKYKGQGK